MTRDRVIGYRNGLPWDIPQEFQHFLKTIKGQTIIMGRKSYEIFEGPMEFKHAIVISRSTSRLENVTVCGTIAEAVERAAEFGLDVYCCGGAQVYTECLPLAEKMYLSFIKKDYVGDTYFPNFDLSQWTEMDRRNFTEFDFVSYERKRTRS